MAAANNHAKKIVHVNQYGSFKGGTENYIYEIAKGIHEYDHYLIYSRDGDENYRSIFKDSRGILNAPDAILEKAVQEIRPAHLIIYNIGDKSMEAFFELRQQTGFKIMKSIHDHSMFYAGQGYNRFTLKRVRRPLAWYSIFTGITRDAFTRKIKFESVFHKRKLLAEVNRVDAIEIHTEEMKGLLQQCGVHTDKAYINPPWATNPGPAAPPSGNSTILFAGNLIRGKGLILLLKALQRVKSSYRLKIAGDGYLRQSLEEYASKNGIQADFLGRMPKKDLADLYRSSAFIVMPSILEGFGFVIMEAMSHSRPAIAFDICGVSEIIKNGVSGYAVKPFDLDELAAKIEELLRNPDKTIAMGREGYKIFLSKFTFEHHLARLREKLSELER